MTTTLIDAGHWFVVRDGDPRALALYLRHYSSKKARGDTYREPRGANARFMGPGEHLILLTTTCQALFAWRKQQYRKDKQYGIECSIFRNEQSDVLASELILEAERWAWQRWPGERLFTFVDPEEVGPGNAGYCFVQAGWTRAGLSASDLRVYEKHAAREIDLETYVKQLEVIECAEMLHESWVNEDNGWMIAAEWLTEAIEQLNAHQESRRPKEVSIYNDYAKHATD